MFTNQNVQYTRGIIVGRGSLFTLLVLLLGQSCEGELNNALRIATYGLVLTLYGGPGKSRPEHFAPRTN